MRYFISLFVLISISSYSQKWQNYVKYDYVPNSSDAVQIWDGEVRHYSAGIDSVICKKGSNFVIIGRDWDSTLTYGIPEKTNAKIAQRSDAYGVVPDVNNFWFAAGGTPNQIPIVCFNHNNVDYLDQIYFKKQEQRLGSEGQEIYEPRISHIVSYTTNASGSDSILRKNYFNVPSKPAVARLKEIGTGKTYTTIESAITAYVSGDTLLVYSGNYTPAAGYIQLNKNGIVIKAVGKCKIITSNATYANLISQTCTMEGFEYSINAASYFFSGGGAGMTINFKSCVNNKGMNWRFPTGTYILTKCISARESLLSTGTLPVLTFNTCYLRNNMYASTINLTVLNCKIDFPLAVDNDLFNIATGSLIIKGCNIETGHRIVSFTTGNVNDSIDIRHCAIRDTGTYTNAYFFYGNTISNNYKFNFFNNIVKSTYSAKKAGFIIIKNVPFDIQRNIFISESDSQISHIAITLDGSRDLSGSKFNYNYSRTNSLGGSVGIGSSIVTTDKLDNLEIIGNRLIGSSLNRDELNSCHILFVYPTKNSKIYYNYISDGHFGIVLKNCEDDWTSGGICYNIFKNCSDNIHLDGLGDILIANNTIYSNNNYIDNFGFATSNIDYVQIPPYEFQAHNNIYRNNIVSVLNSVGDRGVYFEAGLHADGCRYENGILYNALGWQHLCQIDNYYETIESANVAGRLLNCSLTNPNITSDTQLWPVTPITTNTYDCGVNYNTGLDISTYWGDENNYPVIVTKQQTGTWQMGAYLK